MFIEMKPDVKRLLLVNVDVTNKLIKTVSMGNKTKDECSKALFQVKAEYAIHGRMSTKVFNRESLMIPAEERVKAEGIQECFTAAGQKGALAEVNIRIVRMKARSAKAGEGSKYKSAT